LNSHGLDSVLGVLGIPIPPGRHRALPDVELTVQVLNRALAAGQERQLWATMRDLDAVAGVAPRPATAGADDAIVQDTLF
jgi:DNA polymerase-3 subunit epsilon